ncbi:LIMLP_19325 family protein [Leptospira adleri]
MNRHYMKLKAVELKESDLDEHEKLFGIELTPLDREAILKYSGYRTALRFVSSRNSFSRTPVDVGTILSKED